MSNLFKYSNVVCDNNEKKVVDSNDIISEKIVKIKDELEKKQNKNYSNDGFTLGLSVKHVEELLEDDEEYENIEEDVEVDVAAKMDKIQSQADQILEEARVRANQIISEAKSKADFYIDGGRKQAQKIADDARKSGKAEGYNEGKNQGIAEIESLKEELEQNRIKLEKDYKKRIKKMEPELVDTLLKIFAEVTHVLSVDKRELIISLVNSVMSGTDVSKNYIIKVCRDDAQFLRDNKERIQGAVGRNINIEIVEDLTMKRNQCLIDTDLGIFDCSLDIQLENLISDIRILACSHADYSQ